MYYGNKRSKTVHFSSCGHVWKTDAKNLTEFLDYTDSLIEGYHMCRHCNRVSKMNSLYTREVERFASENGLALRLESNRMYVWTNIGEWMIFVDSENHVTLYHRNTYGDRNDYHVQKVRTQDIMEMLEYIAAHDEYRYLATLPKPKTKRPAPRKGTRRYRDMVARQKKQKKKREIAHVLELIDSMSV